MTADRGALQPVKAALTKTTEVLPAKAQMALTEAALPPLKAELTGAKPPQTAFPEPKPSQAVSPRTFPETLPSKTAVLKGKALPSGTVRPR
jgi:hypothetical protein